MFKNLFTRRRRQEMPNFCNSEDDLALIQSLSVEGEYFILVFKPQDNTNFLSGNHVKDSVDVDLDISGDPDYNDLIKNTDPGAVTQIKVYLDKLTIKQKDTSVDCNFLPLKDSETNSTTRVSRVAFKYKQGESYAVKCLNINDPPVVKTLQVVNMLPDSDLITPVASTDAQFESGNLDANIPKIAITGEYEEAYLTNFRVEGTEEQDKNYTQLVVKGDTMYWMGTLNERDHPTTSSRTDDG